MNTSLICFSVQPYHVLHPCFTLVLLFFIDPVKLYFEHSSSTVKKFKYFNKTSSLGNDFYFKKFSRSIKKTKINLPFS